MPLKIINSVFLLSLINVSHPYKTNKVERIKLYYEYLNLFFLL